MPLIATACLARSLSAQTVPRFKTPGRSSAVAAAAATAAAARGFYAVRAVNQANDGKTGSRGRGGVNFFTRVGARGVLAARLLGDVAAAAVASLMVSPFISIVDRSIIQSASGTMSMRASVMQGVRVLMTKPALFLARPDFICTFGLYGATCEFIQHEPQK